MDNATRATRRPSGTWGCGLELAPNQDGGRTASHSASFRRVLSRIERFARDRSATVLIEGEAGTGKTTVARYLHQRSPRAAGPYHAVVLSTLDDALASSELFGHVVGAFTGARASRAGHFVSASGGTLFLDEIGKASKAIQQKLLHAVEYGEIRPVGSDRDLRVDVRVVMATNANLATLVERDEFLPDLFARISAFRVVMPPLRERRQDIPELVTRYIARHGPSAGYSDALPRVSDDLLIALRAAPWPDNLRQLDSTIHRLLVDAEGAPMLTLDHCADDLAWLRQAETRVRLTPQCVDAAIDTAGTISGAARLLGVNRTTVHRFQRKRGVADDDATRNGPVAPQAGDKPRLM